MLHGSGPISDRWHRVKNPLLNCLLSIIQERWWSSESWGRDCRGLNPLTSLPQTFLVEWTRPLLSWCCAAVFRPAGSGISLARLWRQRSVPSNAVVWVGVSVVAKLMRSCGFEHLSQQRATICAWKKTHCLRHVWRHCESLGAQRPLRISAIEIFVSKIPSLLLKYGCYMSIFWGRENLSGIQSTSGGLRGGQLARQLYYWQQLLNRLCSSYGEGLGSAFPCQVKPFPQFASNTASILDHSWSFLTSKIRRSSPGWLIGWCLAM